MKTAKEILIERALYTGAVPEEAAFVDDLASEVIKAMEEYAEQFRENQGRTPEFKIETGRTSGSFPVEEDMTPILHGLASKQERRLFAAMILQGMFSKGLTEYDMSRVPEKWKDTPIIEFLASYAICATDELIKQLNEK